MTTEEELKQPLDPNLDYFDATASIEELAVKMAEMATLQQAMAKAVVQLQQSMIEVRKKQIELEADMAAAGIGAKGEKSALILPDHMKGN